MRFSICSFRLLVFCVPCLYSRNKKRINTPISFLIVTYPDFYNYISFVDILYWVYGVFMIGRIAVRARMDTECDTPPLHPSTSEQLCTQPFTYLKHDM